MYFRDAAGAICGRQEFDARNDLAAVRIAAMLCDACSDSCASYELWDGTRQVHAAKAAIVSDLHDWTEELVVRTEEMIQNSEWAVSRSRRLIDKLAEARRT